MIVVPHTSWHDFYMGLLIRRLLGVEINYVAKKELFRPPFGWYFRWTGGIPLDRTPGQNKVQAISEIFEQRDCFRLAIAPEGTRKKVKDWKTGFYYIALHANVPLVMVALDYRKKEVRVSRPFCLSGERESDFSAIKKFYKRVQGKHAQYH